MFSITKTPEPPAQTPPAPQAAAPRADLEARPAPPLPASPPAPRPKATPSVLSADLTITGNIKTSGDIQVEGTVEGDVRAAHLTVGETATIKGEVVAEEVVVQGRVIGRLRGLKVRLAGSARVEGEIVHKTIAIESGAHFEGSVQRQEDPVGKTAAQPARLFAPKDGAEAPKAAQAAS
jgi:cytoskeletal protein CcmA (bactofilin family)